MKRLTGTTFHPPLPAAKFSHGQRVRHRDNDGLWIVIGRHKSTALDGSFAGWRYTVRPLVNAQPGDARGATEEQLEAHREG